MKTIVLTLVASLLTVSSWPHLLAQAAEQKTVQDAVEGFLLHLGDGEFDKVAADLAPKSLVIVARERDGQPPRAGETEQLHETVPVHRERADRNRDGVDIVEVRHAVQMG